MWRGIEELRSVFIDDKMTLSVNWSNLPSRSFDGPVFSYGVNADGSRDGTLATVPLDVSCCYGSCLTDESGEVRKDIKHLREQKVNYTTDGGAGGGELVKWYKEHPGPFWVYLAYDNWDHFNTPNMPSPERFPWDKCNYMKYSHRMEMYFSSFNHSVQKRGNYDFWNVSMTLEEV